MELPGRGRCSGRRRWRIRKRGGERWRRDGDDSGKGHSVISSTVNPLLIIVGCTILFWALRQLLQALAGWPASLRGAAPPATLAKPPALN
jgi:hypothetical protein